MRSVVGPRVGVAGALAGVEVKAAVRSGSEGVVELSSPGKALLLHALKLR